MGEDEARRDRPRLLIAGYYGYANTGDEAILATMLRDLRALRPSLEFIVVSGDPDHTAATHRVQAIAANDIPAILDAAQTVDAVLLGGGGIFYDYWGCPTDSLLTRDHAKIPFFGAFPLLAGLTRRPCMIYAVGVGPLLSAEGCRLTRVAFEQANLATVRDEESLEVLREIGIKGGEVRLTADPAFGLGLDEVAGRKILTDLGLPPACPRVAVCLRPWTIGVPPDWAERIARILDAFVEQTGAFLVFVPFHGLPYAMEDDVGAAERVRDRLTAQRSAVVLRGALPPEVVGGVVAACDLVVGMRLHSVIFAAIAAVPAIGLVYDPKVASVMRRLGLGEYAVPLDDVDRLAERMAMAWTRRERIRAELVTRIAGLREQAAENALLAIGLLDARPPRAAAMPDVTWLAGFALGQTRKLAEQQTLAERLAGEAAARAEDLAARAADVEVLTARVETLTEQVAALGAQLSMLTGSDGWRFVQAVRRARGRLAPPGGWRDRVVHIGLRAPLMLAAGVRGGSAAARAFLGRVRQTRRRAAQDAARRRHEAQLARILLEHRGRRAVIFLPMVDWGWMVQRPQQLARALAARGCLVFYLTGQMRTDRVDGLSEVADGLYVCADFALLCRIAHPIVVAGNLNHVGGLSSLRHPFVIYDVLDVLDVQVDVVTGEKLAEHAQLLAGAGMVMATSRRLLEDARRVRPDTLLMPNACDPAHFSPDVRRPVPAELAETLAAGGPIAGYHGALAAWFDYDLLDAVAQRLPHWCFVLIGPDYDGTAARLPARDNVRWLGLKDYAALPAYLQTFDVAMIPFVINDITRATSPVKLFEYIAGDRPIVTTPIDEARFYASAAVAEGPEAFAAALEAAYAQRHDPAARRVRARERDANTWDARAAAILEGVAVREAEPRDVAIVLAGVPIDDSGGGHRPAQLTQALLERGWRVVYVHKFAKWEQRDLGLAIRHPRLETCDVVDFDVAAYLDPAPASSPGAAGGRLLALVELPHPDFEPVIAALAARGARVVYDMIDDWASILGGDWYDKAAEARIVSASDILVASSGELVARLAARTGRPVRLVPNAVNRRLFDPAIRHARPPDLPAGRPQILYVGALWGKWFDWALVRRVAEVYPHAALTLIGDYRDQCPYPPPPNMFFLGLKAHRDVPGYLAHADVALIPFVVTPLTQAMSHLKVFEYLAMGVPVVATPSVELTNLPHVHLADTAATFVAEVGRAAEEPVDAAAIAAFRRVNAWEARVDTLLAAIFPENG